jgi:hypothetical protein
MSVNVGLSYGWEEKGNEEDKRVNNRRLVKIA